MQLSTVPYTCLYGFTILYPVQINVILQATSHVDGRPSATIHIHHYSTLLLYFICLAVKQCNNNNNNNYACITIITMTRINNMSPSVLHLRGRYTFSFSFVSVPSSHISPDFYFSRKNPLVLHLFMLFRMYSSVDGNEM